MLRQFVGAVLVTSIAVLGLAACATTTKPEQPQASGPVQPIDAFEKVGEPQRGYPNVGGGDAPGGISTDVQRLQDARRQYNHDKAREAAEHRRSQAECRKSSKNRRVPVEDGSGSEAVYCEKQDASTK